jgi:tetratricopeptide (TPR) repeat protein
MTEIALRTYNQEIKDLIDHGHFDEAIAHCQHILETFPRHIETYRQLGKAFLEQGRHGDAADVFQRVLSAIPEDWLSHVAMAIVREDESNLDMAIWHMERAYEVNPSNTTVQQEVRRLRGRRDGVEPPKLRLTRSALARMYIKGGLFGQAIAEIRSALAEDPDRPDLQTLLASALFDSGSIQEAANICSTVLQKLPYCMEANRILGLALWSSDKKADAEKLFQRLESLDPYIDVEALKKDKRIQEQLGQSIVLTRMEWEQQEKTVRSKQPSWASSLGIKLEEPQGRPAVPDWLATASLPVSAAAAVPKTATSPFGGAAPAWLSEAASAMGTAKPSGTSQIRPGAPPSEPAVIPTAKTATGELPDWIKTQSTAPEPPKVEKPSSPLPDWLATPSISAPEPGAPTTESTLPDWIRATAPASLTPPDQQVSGIPDWLSAPPPPSVEALPPSSLPEWTKPETKTGPLEVEPGNFPDWLTSPKPSSSDIPSEPEWMKPLATSGSAMDAMPDWMKGATTAEPPASAASPLDNVPDWLQETPAAPSKPVEIIPEWMKSESAPVRAAPKEKPLFPFAPESEIPEWMKPEPAETPAPAQTAPPKPSEAVARIDSREPSPIPGTSGPPPEISMPDWLTAAAQPAPIPSAPVPSPAAATPAPVESTEAAAEAVPEVNLPDWLTAVAPPAASVSAHIPSAPAAPPAVVQPAETAAQAVPEVNLPGWLKATIPPAPVAPAPIPSAAPPASVKPTEAVSEAVPEVNFPDWLTAVAAPSAKAPGSKPLTPPPLPAAVQPAETAAEAVPEVTLPDWLTAVTPPAPIAAGPVPLAPEQSVRSTTPLPAPVQPARAPVEAIPEANLPEWIRAAAPSTAVAPVPAPPAPEQSIRSTTPLPPPVQPPAPAPAVASAAPPVPVPAAIEKPIESVPPAPIPSEATPITEGVDLPDWLIAQLQGKTAEPAPSPGAPEPGVPLPDWLKIAAPSPAPPAVVDWEKAASQPLPAAPVDATRPAAGAPSGAEKPAPITPEMPAWLDKSKPSGNETVARWLDRRLKTSTLSSLEDATTKGGPKPPGSAASPRPGQPSTQLPTWLDSQKPGGSDTVVRWMDKRETGSLRRVPQSSFAEAGKAAFPSAGEGAAPKPEAPPVAPPVPAQALEDTVTSKKPSPIEPASFIRPGMEPGRPRPPAAASVPAPAQSIPVEKTLVEGSAFPPQTAPSAEEEEEGTFVPPPEWLQKALGSAVAEVPPIPKGQTFGPEAAKTPPPVSAPVEKKPAGVRWEAASAEEPAPVSSAKPTPWVPIAPQRPVSEAAARPPKKAAKKRTRKLTDIESEALIREAQVYLETDLQKASEAYQKVIENPSSAEVVANDLSSYLEQDPASPQLWNLLGDACSRAGRFQDAYRAYAEALRRM